MNFHHQSFRASRSQKSPKSTKYDNTKNNLNIPKFLYSFGGQVWPFDYLAIKKWLIGVGSGYKLTLNF